MTSTFLQSPLALCPDSDTFMVSGGNMAGRKVNQGSNWIRKDKRAAIYLRDGLCCQYCGCPAEQAQVFTLDHVLACELGGGNEETNLVSCCGICNSQKQDLPLKAWFAKLEERGVDTKLVARRVRKQTRTPIDRDAGKAFVAARKGAKCSTNNLEM